MAAFSYQALDSKGRRQNGVAEADTVRQARVTLRESGFTIVAIEAVSQEAMKTSLNSRWRRGSLSLAQLSLITRQLATLLSASLTLEQALSALIEQS